MGVGVQRESGAVVAQHSGDRFDVHSVLQRQGRESVPIGYYMDNWDIAVFAMGLRFVDVLFPSIFQQKSGIGRVAKK